MLGPYILMENQYGDGELLSTSHTSDCSQEEESCAFLLPYRRRLSPPEQYSP